MSLNLYNTLTRRKETFEPIDPANVRMYVCGPTVYDYAHIGNARPIIVFDVLFRLLRHVYGAEHVTYARNITDVDDKINARAAERYPDMDPLQAIARLTSETTAQFHEDIRALGVLEPTVEPRATGHIEEMKVLCEALVKRGHAYVAEDHVLFDVPSMKDYGRLSNRSLEEMEAGARVDVAPYKRDAMDFVLWKPSKPGEPAWASPCGIAVPGRPGWHLECSAMSEKHLGKVFDIHGGGIDLVFPHHENEVAQSRCAHGTPVMANVWMHNGFLQVEGEKMSKSLGNFITIHELLKQWPGDVIRLQMLTTHYGQPLDWTVERSKEVARELFSWSQLVEFAFANCEAKPSRELIESLSDDLNTPKAIAVLREHARKAAKGDNMAVQSLAADCRFLGLMNLNKSGLFESGVLAQNARTSDLMMYSDAVQGIRSAQANGLIQELIGWKNFIEANGFHVRIDETGAVTLLGNLFDTPEKFNRHVEQRVAARLAARKAKDFKEADRIRDELTSLGVALKDSKDAKTGEIVTKWELAR